MSMVVKNNMSAQKTLNVLNKNTDALQSSLEKVSSGMKINSAKDDAANFAISEKMREQIRSLEQDSQNIQNASSLIKVAEGAVSSTVDILRTIKEKAINAANDSNTDADRVIIQKEIDQFMDQVNDNALVTFNGKYLLEGSTSEVSGLNSTDGSEDDDSYLNADARTAIIKGLSSEWIQASLDLIDESYEYNFEDAGATVKEMEVIFDDNNSEGFLALVRHWSSGGKAVKLELHVNMDYYEEIDRASEDGASATPGASDLDRVIAHELTHAVMAANIDYFGSLPAYIKEGMAELTHGIDDTRPSGIMTLAGDSSKMQQALVPASSTDDVNVDGVHAPSYCGGFILLRYMANNVTGKSSGDVIKDFMRSLNNATVTSQAGVSAALDSAVSVASNGQWANMAALHTAILGNITSINNANTFLTSKCKINLSNEDTGSITGNDADSSNPVKNAQDIVPEGTQPKSWKLPTSSSTTYSGLKVIWPEGYTTEISSDGSVSEYYTIKMTEKKLKMQVGTKANQATNIGFYDMRTKSLGTQKLFSDDESLSDYERIINQSDSDRYWALSYDKTKQAEWVETLKEAQSKNLDDISVVTKKDANIAIRVIDGAIEYALNQQTDIGSYLQRFEYTGLNVTTMTENVQASESTIRDADMAKEMTNYTKNNVLVQSAQAMLAQANQNSSAVLSLLQ